MTDNEILEALQEIIDEFRAQWKLPSAQDIIDALQERGLKVVEDK